MGATSSISAIAVMGTNEQVPSRRGDCLMRRAREGARPHNASASRAPSIAMATRLRFRAAPSCAKRQEATKSRQRLVIRHARRRWSTSGVSRARVGA